MRVYIMTDLEGISGVVDIDYMDRELSFYPDARKLLMGDVNAAIAGCFDSGATEVVIRDGHGGGTNFITDLLDRRAVLDRKTDMWTASLDDSFDATMFVGVHAMAGTLNGFLDHTQNSRMWWRYTINGKPCGEIAQWATMASHFKVPVVYICGDQAGCDEAEALLPGVVTTAVKQGVRAEPGGRHAPHPGPRRHPHRRRPGVGWRHEELPQADPVEETDNRQADVLPQRHGGRPLRRQLALKRVDARTVEKTTRDLLDVLI